MTQTTITSKSVPAAYSTMSDKKREEAIAAYIFVAPAFFIFLVFLVIPIIFSLYISFTDWNGITPLSTPNAYQFVGLNNYAETLLQKGVVQTDFFKALKNTTYYVLGVVPAQTLLALVLAVIVNQRWLKGRGFFRTAFYFPSITSSVVISLIFMFMFTRGGVVNMLIGTIFPNYQYVNWLDDPNGLFHNALGVFGVTLKTAPSWVRNEVAGLRIWDWISGPSTTLLTIMILNTWTTIGSMMVIYLAALQNIPTQVYEAAVVDGASAWDIFRRITVPLLRPTTYFIVTLGLIGCFQVFDQIFVISSGGPAKTTLTIAYLVYSNGFKNSAMGTATATAILLFIIIFVFTMLQRRVVGGEKN